MPGIQGIVRDPRLQCVVAPPLDLSGVFLVLDEESRSGLRTKLSTPGFVQLFNAPHRVDDNN